MKSIHKKEILRAIGRGKTKSLVFLDLETGGLDPHTHEILEIGIIVERYFEEEVQVEHWESKIKPRNPGAIDPVARSINGFCEEGWKDAPYIEEVLPTLSRLLRYGPIIGHNIHFDLSFLRTHLPSLSLGFPALDTMTLAWMATKEGYSLKKIREHYGWDNSGAHTAMYDAEICRRFFWHLLVERRADMLCWRLEF